MTRRFLVTSGLPYSNGRLHVGHVAGAYLPADTYVRYLRATGADVRFICGSDDNGVANLIAAKKENTTPEELSARYNARQRNDFAGLGIEFDIFGGTHQPEYVELHTKISQDFFRSIHEKGFFSKRTTQQLFDPQAGMFLADRYVQGTCPHCKKPGAYGDQCGECGRQMDPLQLIDPISTITNTKPEVRNTTHWYLRLDQFADRLTTWLESKRDAAKAGAVWRPTVINFALGQIAAGLRERAMTRDLDWGIPVPLDDTDAKGKVLYVWFDAPIGYVSFTAKWCEMNEGSPPLLRGDSGGSEGDWRRYERWWKDPDCKIVHFIGEDNTVFHALTWPAMMMADGTYQLPHNVVANSYLNVKFPGEEEEKMSKSTGKAVWIEEYLKMFDPDPLRYYLTAVAPENQRTTFDVDEFLTRNNGELVATLGNFVNRTLTFVHKYFDGRIPSAGERDATDQAQLAACKNAADAVARHLEDCHFKAALGEVMALARAGNGYFDVTAPFRSRKTDMDFCGRAINVCVQTVRTLTTIMAPFLPFSARKCLAMLRLEEDALLWSRATEEIAAGTSLAPTEMLYKKLDALELLTDPHRLS